MSDLVISKTAERLMKDIAFVMTVKSDMVRKQLLWDSRAGCPRCAGTVKFALVGTKLHVRATCETLNCLSVLE